MGSYITANYDNGTDSNSVYYYNRVADLFSANIGLSDHNDFICTNEDLPNAEITAHNTGYCNVQLSITWDGGIFDDAIYGEGTSQSELIEKLINGMTDIRRPSLRSIAVDCLPNLIAAGFRPAEAAKEAISYAKELLHQLQIEEDFNG